jgi:hypothetical protein
VAPKVISEWQATEASDKTAPETLEVQLTPSQLSTAIRNFEDLSLILSTSQIKKRNKKGECRCWQIQKFKERKTSASRRKKGYVKKLNKKRVRQANHGADDICWECRRVDQYGECWVQCRKCLLRRERKWPIFCVLQWFEGQQWLSKYSVLLPTRIIPNERGKQTYVHFLIKAALDIWNFQCKIFWNVVLVEQLSDNWIINFPLSRLCDFVTYTFVPPYIQCCHHIVSDSSTGSVVLSTMKHNEMCVQV